MADITWPADLVPSAMGFYLQPHTQRQTSPLNRKTKVLELSAPQWICKMSFRGGANGKSEQAAYGPRLDAILAELRGGANKALIYDFRRKRLRGDNRTGSGLVSQAALAGAIQISVDGFLPYSLAFMPGDYVGGDDRPHLVRGLTNIYADATGNAVAPIWPPLEIDLASGEAIYGNPTGRFTLTSDEAGENVTTVDEATVYNLEFVEDVP